MTSKEILPNQEQQEQDRLIRYKRLNLSGEQWRDAPIDPITEERNLLSQSVSRIIAIDFDWRRDLSAGGQKLYKLLIKEMGDAELLPTFAAEDEFDLRSAMDELRGYDLLDESLQGIIKLKG